MLRHAIVRSTTWRSAAPSAIASATQLTEASWSKKTPNRVKELAHVFVNLPEWSRSTSPKASRSAGSGPGRRRASTTPSPTRGRETFVVAHPPPNVTGALHTGHALQISLADALVRWHRMRGFNTAFLTGYDHAGISTQNAVEKHLAEQGKSRQELGREAFVELVWDWLREYGGTIMTQFRRIGASMDYRRERFTMDDAYVRAVMRFFVHLYRKGWIYRANRIINWCPFHETSLSDLELVHEEVDDALTYVRYPFADAPTTA